MRYRWVMLAFALGAGAFSAVTACREADTRGAIMLTFNTDLSVPKDVKSVGLYITQAGNVLHFNRYPAVESGGKYLVRFPSTFAVVSNGSATAAPVRVKVVAYREDAMGQPDAFIMREAITRVPTDRTALLRMPLQYLSQGHVKTGTGVTTATTKGIRTLSREPTPDETIFSDCPDPNTQGIIDGVCDSIEIDSATLPTYDPRDAFGGGNTVDDPNASCFAIETCLERPFAVAVDEAGCTSRESVLDPDHLNLAIETNDRLGVCNNGQCRVVLDRVEPNERGGWYLGSDGRAVLPKAVCMQLNVGNIKNVIATGLCASKDVKTPVCAEWTNPSAKPQPITKPAAQSPFGGMLTDAGPGDGGPVFLFENVGPTDLRPMSLVIRGTQGYLAGKDGRVYVFDKNKPDMGGAEAVFTPDTTDAGALPTYGYTIAVVENSITGSTIAVRGARRDREPFVLAEARVRASTAPTWLSAQAKLTGTAIVDFPTLGSPLVMQTLGMVAVPGYGVAFVGKVSNTMTTRYEPFKATSQQLEVGQALQANPMGAGGSRNVDDGAIGADGTTVYFAYLNGNTTLDVVRTNVALPPRIDPVAAFARDATRRVYAIAATDVSSVYMISTSGTETGVYRINKTGLATQTPELVTSASFITDEKSMFNGIAVDDRADGYVYYTATDGVWAVNKVGAPVKQQLAASDARSIVFDRDVTTGVAHVYWTYLASPNGGIQRRLAL
jgi:hypothetical protein